MLIKVNMNKINMLLGAATALALATGCGWSGEEKAAILGQDGTMRVLTIEDRQDSLKLREKSRPLSRQELKGPVWDELARKMISTVTSPEQDGVGIAGPQVGISRRVVAVQRFDKSGEPFEVYPNIRITGTAGDKVDGEEGCLSIPGMTGRVARFRDITIEYTSTKTLRDTAEHILGFTAVIFQHECDHLDGVLYIDRLAERH